MSPEARERITKAAPLLAGTAVACSFAAAGLTNTLTDPGFGGLLHLMILVAVGTSALATLRGVSSVWLGFVVMAMAAAAVTQRGIPVPVLGAMFPAEAIADEDLMWASLFAWLMVGFCFMLSSRSNVLWCLATGLAVFGLTATVNLNNVMLVYFAFMIFAMVFVWGYEHLVNLAETRDRGGPAVVVVGRRQGWIRIARTQALAGTVLVAAVMVAGLVLGTLLYAVGPRLYIAPGGMYGYARWVQASLLSYGGMLNTFYVGQGPVMLPGTPAIEVQADRGALWRGQAYDFYTGRGWNKREAHTYPLEEDGDWLRVQTSRQIAGERLVQRVRLVGIETRALFAAGKPVAVRLPPQTVDGRRMRFHPEQDRYGCLMTTYVVPRGVEYEVVSLVPPSDPETLRAAPQEYTSRMRESYIEQVTPAALAGLEGLVKELTAGAQTPYDKAAVLRDYIEHECVYSDRTPAIPASADAAAYFITRSKNGACDLFATGLAVMCRIAGVPARVATGFLTGSYDRDREAFVPLQRDAHAWAEVYFPTIGWVPFDAAAERELGESTSTIPLSVAQLRRRLAQALDRIWTALLGVGAVAALLSALLGPGVLWRWLRRRMTPRSTRVRIGEGYEWFRRRAARLAGIRLEKWRTPNEMNEALAGVGLVGSSRVRRELEAFTQTFYAQRYGPDAPSEGQVRRLSARARRLLNMMRRRRRSGQGERT